MTRVLQLISAQADFQTQRTADLLLNQSGPGFHVARVTFGRGGDWPNPLALGRHLRRLPGLDLIHAWGTVAATVAALAARTPLLATLEPLTRPRAIGWLKAVMGYQPLHVVCGSAVQHRAAVVGGIAPDRCHLIRPGVEFSRVRRQRDVRLRADLGFDDADVVLLVPGESDRDAGHERAGWVTSILHVMDPRYKLLLLGEGPRAAAVAGLARRLHQPALVTLAPGRPGQRLAFESLLGAADLALVTPAGAMPLLPVLSCMAAGLPIVAVTTASTAELLEDRHTAWMTTTASPRELARRVLDVRADPSAAHAYGDRARSEVFDLFSASRLLGDYRPLLRRVAAGESMPVHPGLRHAEPLHPAQLADRHEPRPV